MGRVNEIDAVSAYDRRCAEEFARLHASIDRYFVELKSRCPYGLPYEANFYQALFGPLGDHAMELFLAAGYRRNGNCLYTMRCAECKQCIPVRLQAAKFQMSRSQKRVLRKNQDVEISFKPLVADKEHLDLCGRFLDSRYPQDHNSSSSYYNSFFCNTIADSMCIDFRLDGRLVGGSIVDVGTNWMNAVYFYFDPEESKRSLGTYNIMMLIKFCLEMNVTFLYLGYFIEEISAMSYKRKFLPQQLFRDNQWLTIV